MKTTFLLFIFSIFFSINLEAQKDSTNENVQSLIFFNLGVQLTDYENLNLLLSKNSYSTINNTNFSFGGGQLNLVPKMRIALMENIFYYEQTSTSQTINTKLTGTGLGFGIGYILLNKPKLNLIPYGGAAVNWINLNMFNTIPNGTTLSNYLISSTNNYQIKGTSYLFDLGIIGSSFISIDKETNDKMMIGFKAGYYIPITNAELAFQKTKLSETPKINPGGFYVGLTFGFSQ